MLHLPMIQGLERIRNQGAMARLSPLLYTQKRDAVCVGREFTEQSLEILLGQNLP